MLADTKHTGAIGDHRTTKAYTHRMQHRKFEFRYFNGSFNGARLLGLLDGGGGGGVQALVPTMRSGFSMEKAAKYDCRQSPLSPLIQKESIQ